MTAKRKRHKPEFKAQVALEAYKGDKTINQLASEHEVAAVQVSQWKRQLLQGVPEVFGRTRPEVDPDALTAPLYQEIGRLKMELDWLKKKSKKSGAGLSLCTAFVVYEDKKKIFSECKA